MFNNIFKTDSFYELPNFLVSVDSKKELDKIEMANPKNVEEDAHKEEEYLGYLFHFHRDISHIKCH